MAIATGHIFLHNRLLFIVNSVTILPFILNQSIIVEDLGCLALFTKMGVYHVFFDYFIGRTSMTVIRF